MKIQDLIGETTAYDKKEKLEERKPKSWLKSVSAFANGQGGALIFGVSDDDSLVGLGNAREVSEKISEIIKTKMDPLPAVSLEIHTEEEKEFVILHVSAGRETPYYYVGEGNYTAYIRIGNESVPANALALKRLVLRGANKTYDSLPSPYTFEKAAFTKLKSSYYMRTGMELADQDFISFELMDESGQLTNAGALLADDPLIRHSRLFCTRWNGLTKASGVMDALDDKEYSGSLISLLQNGIEFVKNNSKKRWKKTGAGRIEMPEYPEQAVHETLVNALIHRDYTEIGSEVHIDLFDDRLEIYSPGGMPDGSIIQDIDLNSIASMRRNPIIADLFSRMHFMERRGSGFKKIKEDYQRAVNYSEERKPYFTSTPSAFFVTLYNLNYGVEIEKTVPNEEKTVLNDEKAVLNEEKTVLNDEKAVSNEENTAPYWDEAVEGISQPTKEKIELIYQQFEEKSFSWKDISSLVDITKNPALSLLRKMRELDLIVSVPEDGRGKYKFKH